MLEQEQQFYIDRLFSWNGYHRQDALVKLADCYDEMLFPILLKRLSDYVPINRQLASEHLTRWSEHADFSALCVAYFEDVAAIQQRIRIVSTVEDILLRKTAENMPAIKEVFLKQQGKRPRLFLAYIQRYHWLDEHTLLQWCEQAKDQRVRGYWLNHLIQMNDLDALKVALYSTPYRNIKMKLLPILYEKNAFSLDEYLGFLQQPSLSMMEFAIFALKKQQFDFMNYFNAQPFAQLMVQNQRLRLYQWVLLGLDDLDFKKYLSQISQRSLQLSILNFARQQGYLSSVNYLQQYVNLTGKLEFYTLYHFNQKSANKLNIQNLMWVCEHLCSELLFLQGQTLVADYGYWDQFLWLIQYDQYLHFEGRQYFHTKLMDYIREAQYQYYPPSWQQSEKQKLLQLLDRYSLMFEQYSIDPQVCHLRQILQK